MKKELIGILVVMLFMSVIVLPVSAIQNTNKEFDVIHEEKLSGDGTAVFLFLFSLLDGYEIHDNKIEFHFKIGWMFVFGFDCGRFICGPVPLIGEEKLYDNTFKGKLTQSFVCGYLFDDV